MVALATRVDHVECAHPLEAGVRELRLLSAHVPPYNRRSKFPMRGWWVTLTNEVFSAPLRGPYAHRRRPGPLPVPDGRHGRRRDGGRVLWAADLYDADREGAVARTEVPAAGHRRLSCDRRRRGGLPRRARDGTGADPGRGGRAAAACARSHRGTRRRRVVRERGPPAGPRGDPRPRPAPCATARRAGRRRRTGRRPAGSEGRLEFAVIRAGRLASAGVSRRGVAPMPVVEALVASAETVLPDPVPLRGASPEELAVHRALARRRRCADRPDQPRLSEPAHGAGSWEDWCTLAGQPERLLCLSNDSTAEGAP